MLPDVLMILGPRRGVLALQETGVAGSVEFHLQERHLCGSVVDGTPIQSARRAQYVFSSVIMARKGAFVFRQLPAVRNDFWLPLERLIFGALTALDEVDRVRDQLPSADTVFQLRWQTPRVTDPALRRFLDRVWVLLVAGASSRQLSSTCDIPLDSVLLVIHKLRVLGVVTPVRAADRARLPDSTRRRSESLRADGRVSSASDHRSLSRPAPTSAERPTVDEHGQPDAQQPMTFTPMLRRFFRKLARILSSQ